LQSHGVKIIVSTAAVSDDVLTLIIVLEGATMGLDWCIRRKKIARSGEKRKRTVPPEQPNKRLKINEFGKEPPANKGSDDSQTMEMKEGDRRQGKHQEKRDNDRNTPDNGSTKPNAEADCEGSDEEEEVNDEDDIMSVRIGSYSGVQTLRAGWISAAIKYLESQHRDESDKLAARLGTWKTGVFRQVTQITLDSSVEDWGSFFSSIPVDYKNVPQKESDPDIQMLANVKLLGLWYFVNHSDSDGEYSVDEARDIHKAYELLQPHMSKDIAEWCETSIVPVLEMAIEKQLPIVFC
jgi:hypothetical protein